MTIYVGIDALVSNVHLLITGMTAEQAVAIVMSDLLVDAIAEDGWTVDDLVTTEVGENDERPAVYIDVTNESGGVRDLTALATLIQDTIENII
jgi:hypothetical protein